MGYTINAQTLLTETNNFGDLGLGELIIFKWILKRRMRNNLLLKKVLWRVVVNTIMKSWIALMTTKMYSLAG
jgi:hypothetical protein